MPRIHGYRERLHQPLWDHLLRTTGVPAPAVRANNTLFGAANVGDFAETNMAAAGQLPSDQTFVILALRAYLYFDGTNLRRNYNQVSSQLFFTLELGNKPQFSAPCWYYPAGGGIWGFSGTAATAVFANGEPTQEAILKLARPIIWPVRQNIAVQANFFPMGATDIVTGLNAAAADDQAAIAYLVDGLQTRDVL